MAGDMQQPGPLGLRPQENIHDGTVMQHPGPLGRNLRPLEHHQRWHIHTTSLPKLNWGSRGEDVAKLQRLLNRRIIPTPMLRVDGNFGNHTYAAVRIFQFLRGITVDGIVGPLETWPHLLGGKTVDRGRAHWKGLPDAPPAPPQAPAKRAVEITETVWEWSFRRKMEEVVRRAVTPMRLGEAAFRELGSLLDTEDLVAMLTVGALITLLTGGLATAMFIIALGSPIAISLAECLQTTAYAQMRANLTRLPTNWLTRLFREVSSLFSRRSGVSP